jgi:hypothetical protein
MKFTIRIEGTFIQIEAIAAIKVANSPGGLDHDMKGRRPCGYSIFPCHFAPPEGEVLFICTKSRENVASDCRNSSIKGFLQTVH